ncbi:MAG: isoprenyl transferase [Proteobacteria bacterium]|jgi:undecaprenyl diphosphate synthase|nr:isoprenyl transferase [Pseudomonadota bacterium]
MACNTPAPRHVAIIMDGNGRWALRRNLKRLQGHRAGADSVRRVVRECVKRGVEVLTLYSFSTENWGRPQEEVSGLMELLKQFLRQEQQEMMDSSVRLRAIGELDRLPSSVMDLLDAVVALTAQNDGMLLQLALSYGGRSELVQATRAIAQKVALGQLPPASIDEKVVAEHLYTAGQPDPDLLIRSSGEYRLSNFLLWQAAYSEIYVTDVMWPDFSVEHLDAAFQAYFKRHRRFGQTGSEKGGS